MEYLMVSSKCCQHSFIHTYINDLPKIVNYNTKPVMFANDTSVIVSNPDLENFKNDIISSFRQLDDWFRTNLLSLNYNKTQFIQFRTINSLTVQLDISYNNKYIIHDTNTRFLGITIDSSLSLKHHTEGLAIKLSRACNAIRSLRPSASHKSLKMIYFAYFHAVMS
jgi:hypothetical protein